MGTVVRVHNLFLLIEKCSRIRRPWPNKMSISLIRYLLQLSLTIIDELIGSEPYILFNSLLKNKRKTPPRSMYSRIHDYEVLLSAAYRYLAFCQSQHHDRTTGLFSPINHSRSTQALKPYNP